MCVTYVENVYFDIPDQGNVANRSSNNNHSEHLYNTFRESNN